MQRKNKKLFNKEYYKIIKLFLNSYNMRILLRLET
jgi:hypothetical protein